jgi:mono/diheme cytochrome c family protein
VDNQLAQFQISIKYLIILALVLVLLGFAWTTGLYWYRTSDPYVHEVLSLHGDVAKGHAIFQINCAGCHGVQANGSVGPSLRDVSRRKTEVGIIHQVVRGQTPPMPRFQPSSQTMADLLSYLEQL